VSDHVAAQGKKHTSIPGADTFRHERYRSCNG
jgi:hypothetical protein